jgi:hypothetical protein
MFVSTAFRQLALLLFLIASSINVAAQKSASVTKSSLCSRQHALAARALLALANLYAKIDTDRGIEELANAVRTINALDKPDFSQEFVMIKIEGKNFASYAGFSTPGFNPETAFATMGKLDFDGTFSQAATFTDKSLKALTTLAVVEPCLAVDQRLSLRSRRRDRSQISNMLSGVALI